MAKTELKSFYFPHDYHARYDPKLMRLRMEIGPVGDGIYWDLVEMLYEEGGILALKDIPFIAKTLNTTAELVEKVVKTSELFIVTEKDFYSGSLINRLKHINKKRGILSKNGRLGGIAKAKQKPSNCLDDQLANGKPKKERKENKEEKENKESKGKDTKENQNQDQQPSANAPFQIDQKPKPEPKPDPLKPTKEQAEINRNLEIERVRTETEQSWPGFKAFMKAQNKLLRVPPDQYVMLCCKEWLEQPLEAKYLNNPELFFKDSFDEYWKSKGKLKKDTEVNGVIGKSAGPPEAEREELPE